MISLFWGQKANAQIFEVGTMLSSDVLLEWNAHLSMRISRHSSLLLNAEFNPLQTSSWSIKNCGLGLSYRWWRTECFYGHFISVDTLHLNFRVGKQPFLWNGNGTALGLGYGYSWIIRKRLNLTLEASLGLWYIKAKRYVLEEDEFLPNRLYHLRRFMFLPLNAGLSIGYMF